MQETKFEKWKRENKKELNKEFLSVYDLPKDATDAQKVEHIKNNIQAYEAWGRRLV